MTKQAQQTKPTPADVIAGQISVLREAIEAIKKTIDDVTGEVNPDEATWVDVSKLSWMVDGVKRAGLAGESV